MRIIDEIQLDFDDISIMPKRSSLNSRSEVDITRTFKWVDLEGYQHELTCKPIISAIMTTVGTPKMARELVHRGYLASVEKHYGYEDLDKLYTDLEHDALFEGKPKEFYTDKISLCLGIRETNNSLSIDTVKKLMETHKVNIIHLDAPNAYIPIFKDRVVEIRKAFPAAFLIAGVVVTSDLTTDLINLGCNCVSLAICAGSVCITASKTGVRRGLVSTIVECADAAHQLNGYVLLSGGLRNPADIMKSFGCGCDICMTGSLLASTDVADGEIVTKRYLTNELDENGNQVIMEKKFKKYFGMSSNYAQMKYLNEMASHRTSEGRTKLIPYSGTLDEMIRDIEGGIRSSCCYIGARNMKEISKKCTFYRTSHTLNTIFDKCEDFK